MPDGDKIHDDLRHFYQNAYKQLCEDSFDAENVAREVLRAIRKAHIYDGSNRPLMMLADAEIQFLKISTNPTSSVLVDWGKESAEMMREKLMGLYSRYAREWREVSPYFCAA